MRAIPDPAATRHTRGWSLLSGDAQESRAASVKPGADVVVIVVVQRERSIPLLRAHHDVTRRVNQPGEGALQFR